MSGKHTKKSESKDEELILQELNERLRVFDYTAKSYVLNQNWYGSDSVLFTFPYRPVETMRNRTLG